MNDNRKNAEAFRRIAINGEKQIADALLSISFELAALNDNLSDISEGLDVIANRMPHAAGCACERCV